LLSLIEGRWKTQRRPASLAEFASLVEAVRCAIDIQNSMIERNAGVPSNADPAVAVCLDGPRLLGGAGTRRDCPASLPRLCFGFDRSIATAHLKRRSQRRRPVSEPIGGGGCGVGGEADGVGVVLF